MRSISPRQEPVTFTNWRAASQNDINYGYELIPSGLRQEIKDTLIDEQKGLCAYTGIGIDASHSHIEHLLPQAHCRRGREDVEYRNMVACFPAPGNAYVPFGALRKAHWPSLAEKHFFVSPRSAGCEARFTFNMRGRISVAKNDEAARETVKRLGLDHKELEGLRNDAINSTLRRWGKERPLLDLPSARRRLAGLEEVEAAGGPLEPFCFVLKQALRQHIRLLESIRESKKKKRGK